VGVGHAYLGEEIFGGSFQAMKDNSENWDPFGQMIQHLATQQKSLGWAGFKWKP
jgi:hypothetical protein